MTMRPHGCDYCSQTLGNKQGDTLHEIPLSRTPNGDKIKAEICTTCLGEIMLYSLSVIQATRNAMASNNVQSE
jgi:hypothetical protein